MAFLLILSIFCCQSCKKVEKVEATTEVGLLTNYNFEPQTLKGRVKSLSEKSYLLTEENGAISKASWISKDTVRSYLMIHSDENGFFTSAERYEGGVDTITNTFEYDCNEMGRWVNVRSHLADGS